MQSSAAWAIALLAAHAATALPAQPETPDPDAAARPETKPGPERETEIQPVREDSAPPGTTPGVGFFSGSYTRAQRPLWNAELEANAWYVSPGGDVAIGGSPLVETAALNVDSPVIGPLVELHTRFDPITISFRGSLLDAQGIATLAAPAMFGGVAFSAGDTVQSDYRLDTGELRIGYRVAQFDADKNANGRPLLSAGIDLVGGLRVYDGDISVTGIGGTAGAASADFTHIEPLIGIAADVAFGDRYEIQFQNSHAGTPKIDGQSSFSTDIQVTFKYRPAENLSIQIGYRLRNALIETPDLEINGAIAGLFAGMSLRF